MKLYYFESPIGRIALAGDDTVITNLYFANAKPAGGLEPGSTPLLERGAGQVLEYLKGERRCFDLPIQASGTPFFREVWKKLLEIPYGETRSYKDIATAVGNPKATRAVGLANNRNPIPLIIPCHRVVGSGGKLVGFGGGLDVKEKLLFMERNNNV